MAQKGELLLIKILAEVNRITLRIAQQDPNLYPLQINCFIKSNDLLILNHEKDINFLVDRVLENKISQL